MTVCIGLIYQNKAFIGADTRWSSPEKQFPNTKNRTKLFKFPGFIVGISGTFTIVHVLERLQKCKKVLRVRNIEEAKAFCDYVYGALKEEFSKAPTGGKKSDYGDILIVTPTKIFACDPYLSIMEKEKFAAIGGGEDIALGALGALYQMLPETGNDWNCPFGYHLEGKLSLSKEDINDEVLRAMLSTVLDITCQHVLSCGPPLEILKVEKCNEPKRKVTRHN